LQIVSPLPDHYSAQTQFFATARFFDQDARQQTSDTPKPLKHHILWFAEYGTVTVFIDISSRRTNSSTVSFSSSLRYLTVSLPISILDVARSSFETASRIGHVSRMEGLYQVSDGNPV
jgi:hypothetical protein